MSSVLYRGLLTDSSQLVRQRGLDAFAAFASQTPHAALISAAVSCPAGLQAAASDHLQRLAGRRRGPAALTQTLRSVGASSAGTAAVPEILAQQETRTESVTDSCVADGQTSSGAGASVTAVPADCLTDGPCPGGAGRPIPDGAGSPLPEREARLLDSIQRRLAELRRRGGRTTDGDRLLRLLTDLQARLDAG